MNTLYCSGTHLKLAVGESGTTSVKIRDYAERLLPDGAMINGIITDENVMTNFFANVNTEFALAKDPTTLIINNNNITTKVMDMPPVNEDRMIEFIRRDFTQYNDASQNEEAADDVYDYTVLSPKTAEGGMKVLAVSVGREFLQTYRNVLSAAGFDLKVIDIGLNCQIKLAHSLPALQQPGKTVLVLLDGKTMSLTLFVNGLYDVMNRYRLLHSPGDPEWLSDVTNNISSMIQFGKTGGDSVGISSCWFAGFTDEQIDGISQTLAYTGIAMKELDFGNAISLTGNAAGKGDFDADEYILNIGALLKK